MYNEDYLRTLKTLKKMVYVPDYVEMDEDTYAFGTLEAMSVVLDAAIKEVTDDLEESRRSSAEFYKEQYKLQEKKKKEETL